MGKEGRIFATRGWKEGPNDRRNSKIRKRSNSWIGKNAQHPRGGKTEGQSRVPRVAVSVVHVGVRRSDDSISIENMPSRLTVGLRCQKGTRESMHGESRGKRRKRKPRLKSQVVGGVGIQKGETGIGRGGAVAWKRRDRNSVPTSFNDGQRFHQLAASSSASVRDI